MDKKEALGFRESRVRPKSRSRALSPNIIQLAGPEAPVGLVHRVDFAWEEINRREFQGWPMRADRKTEHVHGTIIGLFETRSPITDLVKFSSIHPEGQILGFGPGNPAPAQIIVRSITDIRIQKNNAVAEGGNERK